MAKINKQDSLRRSVRLLNQAKKITSYIKSRTLRSNEGFYGRKSTAKKIIPILKSALSLSPVKQSFRAMPAYRSPTGVKVMNKRQNGSPLTLKSPGNTQYRRVGDLAISGGDENVAVALFQDEGACDMKRGEFKPKKTDKEVHKKLAGNPRKEPPGKIVVNETISKKSCQNPAKKESQQKHFNYLKADEIIRAFLISAIKKENPGIKDSHDRIQKLINQAYEYSHQIARSFGGAGAREMQAWVSSKAFNSAHAVLAEHPGYEIITKENQTLHFQSDVLLMKKGGVSFPIISSEVITWISELTKRKLEVKLDFDTPTPSKQLKPYINYMYKLAFSVDKENVQARQKIFTPNNKQSLFSPAPAKPASPAKPLCIKM